MAAYAVAERDGFNLIDKGVPGSGAEILDLLAQLPASTGTPPSVQGAGGG